MRILLVAAAISAGAMPSTGWIFERFVADFMPLLVLAAMIGLVDLWGRMSRVSCRGRVAVVLVTGALALFGFWANMGYAVIPQGYWNRTQTHHYFDVARPLSDLTGHPLNSKVVVGNRFPGPVPMGTLFVKGRCAGLYLAIANVPVPNFRSASSRSTRHRTRRSAMSSWLRTRRGAKGDDPRRPSVTVVRVSSGVATPPF